MLRFALERKGASTADNPHYNLPNSIPEGPLQLQNQSAPSQATASQLTPQESANDTDGGLFL